MARNLHIGLTIAEMAVTRVVQVDSEAELGRPPTVDAEVRLEIPVPLENLIAQPVLLEMGFDEEAMHRFRGIVESAEIAGSAMAGKIDHRYRFRLVTPLSLLSRYVDAVIFQEKNVQEIVDEVLQKRLAGALPVEWRLSGSYPTRTYCVQYMESDLDFVHRLLEQEGIYYFFEHGPDESTLVFSDDSPSAAPIDGDPLLPVRMKTDMTVDRDQAFTPSDAQRVRSGKFVYRDYNFEKPALDMTAEAEADADGDLEVYDYPGEYAEPDEGKRLAQVRLEAEQVARSTLRMEAVCPRVVAGRQLSLGDIGDLDGDYFVVRCRHHFDDGGGEAPDLRVHVELIEKDVPFRILPFTPKPRIYGPQTATVVAPDGSEPETIHTEEFGRCKVSFHWDRSGVTDDKASCWMRVAQLQTSGSLILPRVDWEVIVEFLDGNPDRPVITGRLYNGRFMPLYKLPDGKTRTSLFSASTPGGGGSNEIRFEDKAGSEEIFVHAQHDQVMATANNKKTTVGNNLTSVVGANSSLSVGNNQKIQITKGNANTITADQTVTVGANRKVEVNAVTGLTCVGSATTTVGGNQFEMDGNPLDALLELAAKTAQAFLEAAAAQAIGAIQAQVQGAVNQALGPIDGLVAQATSLGGGLQALQGGNLGALGGLTGAAGAIPGAGALVGGMGGGGGNIIAAAAQGALRSPRIQAQAAANQAIADAGGAAQRAVHDLLSGDAEGGGGESQDNVEGPEGNVDGVEGTDRTKGPGHAIGKITGSYTETVGGIKAVGLLNGHDTKVAGDMTQNAGAAHVEICIGSRSESGQGNKTETQLGLVVLSKGGESETVTGARTTMVGGAIVDKLKGSHQVEAGGPATFIGAFHKMEAKGAITLKCGASEIVIDKSGVTVTSPMVTFMAGKIHLPKDVSEV